MKCSILWITFLLLLGCGGNGSQGQNAQVNPTPPDKTNNVKADPGDQRIIVSWLKAQNATSYDITYYLPGVQDPTTMTFDEWNFILENQRRRDVTSPYTDLGTSGGGLLNYYEYAYQLIAINDFGETRSDWIYATPLPTISIDPILAMLGLNGIQTFIATVRWHEDTSITWNIQEGIVGGSINQAGNYIGPNTYGNYHVIATSNADPAKTAIADVWILPQPK